MENKKKNNTFLIIVLLILVLGLTGYIVYDKFLSSNNEVEKNTENNQTNQNNIDDLGELKKLEQFSSYSKEEIKLWFEDNFFAFFPKFYIDNHIKPFQVSNLTDEEISIFVWDYIYHHATSIENVNEIVTRKMEKSLVDSYLKRMFKISNYDVKPLKDNYPSQPRLLITEDNYYIASEPKLYLSSEMLYRITDFHYNADNLELLMDFTSYIHGADKDYNQDNGVATFKLDEGEKVFYLTGIDIK